MPGALGPGRFAPPTLNMFRTPHDAGLSDIPDRGGLGDIYSDALVIGGTAATGGTGAAVIAAGTTLISAFTGGAQVDQQRQARVNYFLQQAEQGNVAAAQLILGAPDNVSGNERTMWVSAAQILQSNPTWRVTLQAAQAEGPVWLVGSGDTATNYPAMKAFTAQWASQNQPVATAARAAGQAAQAVVAKTPTLVWVGAAAALYFVLASRRRG